MAEGGGLLNRYSALKALSRVRIPPSPPYTIIVLVCAAIAFCASQSRAQDAPPCLNPDEKVWIARAYDPIVALNEHASQCLDEHRYPQAIAEWKSAIAKEDDASLNHDAYLDVLSPRIGIGLAYERSGKWREAREAWLAAQAFHGKLRYKGWYLYADAEIPDKANALFERGKYGEALAAYDYNYNTGAFEDSGVNPVFDRSKSDAIAGRYDAARTGLLDATRLAPDLYPAHLLLGDISFIDGDGRRAVAEWEQTLLSFSADPPDSFSRYYQVHWAALSMLIHYVGIIDSTGKNGS